MSSYILFWNQQCQKYRDCYVQKAFATEPLPINQIEFERK